jgi:hypothetical protein
MKEWKCDNCGCCCRLKKCKEYVDGRCAVYETRPQECRSEYAWKKYRPDLSWELFIELSKIYCHLIRDYEKGEDMNCLIYELKKRNPDLKVKDKRKLIPIKEGLEIAKGLVTDGIKFVFNGKNWHANSYFGIPIDKVDFDGLVGEPMSLGTAMLLSGGIAAGGSILGGMMAGDGGMEQGYDIYEPEAYEYGVPMLETQADWYNQELARLQRGELPSYLQSALPQMRQMMVDPLYRSYYGTPGDRSQSVIGAAQQAGAQMGLGAKPVMAQVNKAAEQAAFEEQQIDKYLAGIVPSYMQTQQNTVLQGMSALPKYKPYEVINLMGGVSGGQGGGSQLDLSGMQSMLGNYAAGNWGTNPTQTPGAFGSQYGGASPNPFAAGITSGAAAATPKFY